MFKNSFSPNSIWNEANELLLRHAHFNTPSDRHVPSHVWTAHLNRCTGKVEKEKAPATKIRLNCIYSSVNVQYYLFFCKSDPLVVWLRSSISPGHRRFGLVSMYCSGTVVLLHPYVDSCQHLLPHTITGLNGVQKSMGPPHFSSHLYWNVMILFLFLIQKKMATEKLYCRQQQKLHDVAQDA